MMRTGWMMDDKDGVDDEDGMDDEDGKNDDGKI